MHLIVPYLLPPEHFLQAAAQDLRLPALETMIARGRRDSSSPVGLEGALCRAWGIDRQSDWPWAALSLGVDGGTAEQSYWLRTDPVHIRIQRDRLILLGSDLLDLQPEEAAALCADLHVSFRRSLRSPALAAPPLVLANGTGPADGIPRPFPWLLAVRSIPCCHTAPTQ